MSRHPFLVVTLLVACNPPEPEPNTSSTTQELNGFEGMFEFAIDLPWRMEPRLGADNRYHYDQVPITLVIHDEDTNEYSPVPDFTSPINGWIAYRLYEVCKVTVSRYREGEAAPPDTFVPSQFEWIEFTGRDPGPPTTPPRPTYWPTADEALPDPFHAVCHPGTQDCRGFESFHDSSEWHAMLKWDPGEPLAGFSETLELIAYVSDKADGCDSRQVKLRNYARVNWAEAPLPRFGDDRWIYGDLHYHSQSTDNEGESGYSYRAVAETMGAMGIDFAFATDHASNSTQIVDVDAWFELEKRGLRDLDAARWDWALRTLHDPGGANGEVAASWPNDRPRVPRLFLGGEVDVAPEITQASPTTDSSHPAWKYTYANGREADIYKWATEGFEDFLGTQSPVAPEDLERIFRPAYDVNGQLVYLLGDAQGFNAIHTGRQHLLHIPRYQDPTGFVPSSTGIFGGATRRLVEGNDVQNQGVLPEIFAKQSIAFLAHPNSLGGGDKGPGSFPFTDYQYAKAFDQQALVGLQLWNENKRFSSTERQVVSSYPVDIVQPGDYDVSGYDFVTASQSGNHAGGVVSGEYKYVPMYDLDSWGWGRISFDVDEQLHNGAYVWDRMLRWGLDLNRTSSISWITPVGDPRRMFMAGGSDAHGDFSYRREGYLTNTSAANDTAFAKVRNLVLAGDPRPPCPARDPKCPTNPPAGPATTHSQDQVVGALAEGRFSITDGPAIRIVVDRNRNNIIDDDDYPMGSVVELYGDNPSFAEQLPLIVEWESTQEFGPVERIDLYIGVDTDTGCAPGACEPDPSRAVTYAPLDHGVRRGPWETDDLLINHDPIFASVADPLASSCTPSTGLTACEMADKYWLPIAGPARDRLRITPTSSQQYAGERRVSIDFDQYRAKERATKRAYVRAFVRTVPPCDVFSTETRPEVKYSGACVSRYGFTNPVWALRHAWAPGMACPTSVRSLDRDLDGLPDFCDGAPDSPNNSGVSRVFGGASADSAQATAFDSAGSVFVAGSVTNTGRIERNAQETTPYSAAGTDAMLVKYSATNVYAQHLQMFGTGASSFTDIASDGSGNLYVTGSFTGANQLGAMAMNASDSDAFVAKIRGSDLAVLWIRPITGAGVGRATDLAVTAGGQVVVAGDFSGTMTAATTIVSEGGFDCYVLRLSAANGAQQDLRRFGGTGHCNTSGIAVDATGRAFVAATYGGALTAGAFARTSNATDSVVVRMGSASEGYAPLATTWLGNPSVATDESVVTDVALTSTGGVIAVGDFRGTFASATGTGAFTSHGLALGTDGFVVTISATTAAVTLPTTWKLGGPGTDYLDGVATDAYGHILVTGAFESPSITTSLGTLTRTSLGDGMFFLLDDTLTITWQRDFGTTGRSTARAGAFFGNRVAVAGTIGGQAQIDDQRIVNTAGNYDGFVAVFTTP